MKKIFLGLMALALIAGCSTKPTEPTPTATPDATVTPETTPDANQPATGDVLLACETVSDNDTIVVTLNGTDGMVTEITQEVKYGLTADRDAETIKKSLEADKEANKNIEGVTFVIEETDAAIIQKVTYQLDKLDADMIANAGLEGLANVDGKYALADVQKVFETSGATCK